MLAPQIDERLAKASGYSYRNGYDTAKEFEARYGFAPFAPFFRVTRSGLVVTTESFTETLAARRSEIASNWAAIL